MQDGNNYEPCGCTYAGTVPTLREGQVDKAGRQTALPGGRDWPLRRALAGNFMQDRGLFSELPRPWICLSRFLEEGSLNDEDVDCSSTRIVCVRHCGGMRLGSRRTRRRRHPDHTGRPGRCRWRSDVDGHPTAAQPGLDPVSDSGHVMGGHSHRRAGEWRRTGGARIRRPRRRRQLPGLVAGADRPGRQSLGATGWRDGDRQALFRRRGTRPDERCVQLQRPRHRRMGPAPAAARRSAFDRLLPRSQLHGRSSGRYAEGDCASGPRRPGGNG